MLLRRHDENNFDEDGQGSTAIVPNKLASSILAALSLTCALGLSHLTFDMHLTPTWINMALLGTADP